MTRAVESLGCLLALALLAAGSAATSATRGAVGQGDSVPTREEAGPDYAVQGEYVGRLTVAGVDEMFGVQVVAAGNAEF